LLIASACGQDAPKEVDRDAIFDRLEADIVVRAYEEGRLGTKDQVEADMGPYCEKLRVPDPIDASGRMSPFDDMSDRQQMCFNDWHRSSQNVLNIVGPEILRADQDRLKKLDKEEKG
jgi:hypothetical protein